MIPEYHPPRGLRDPFVNRAPMKRTDWNRAIAGQLPKLADFAVAYALSNHGSKDGSRCYPRLERLARELRCDKKTVPRSLDYLAEHGWITLTNPGVRTRGEANCYELSVPAPYAVQRGWWTDQHGPQWVRRPAGEPKRPGVGWTWTTQTPKHGGHRRPPKRALGGHSEPLGGHGCPQKVDTNDHPPGSTYQGFKYHSESFRFRARPGARADDTAESNPWAADDLDDQIADVLEAEGYDANYTMIGEMRANGWHPNAIINTAKAQQDRGDY